MEQNLYVDNVISGSLTEASAVQYFTEARKIMSDANFNLRSWASNSQQLRTIAQTSGVIDENDIVKCLDYIGTLQKIDYVSFRSPSTHSTVLL